MAVNINGTGSITGLSSISSPGISGVPVGSASAPAFSFTGDSNTGIYSPGADQVAISTNGAGRLFINSSGNVGVGIANPAQKIHLSEAGATNLYQRWSNNADTNNAFVGLQSNGLFSIEANQGLAFLVGASYPERLRITAAGLVGVGTSAPSNQAHIYRTDSGTSNGALRLDGNGNYAGLQFAASGTNYGSIAADNATLYITHANGISLRTGNSGNVGGTDRLFVDSSGRVGIGTTTAGSYSPNADNLVIADAGSGGITIATGTSSYGGIYFADGTSGADQYRGVVQYGHTDNAMEFYTNGNERFRCDSSGRLLVGTSSAFPVRVGTTSGTPQQQLAGTNGFAASFVQGCASTTDAAAAYHWFAKFASATIGDNTTIVASDEILGGIGWSGSDGVNQTQAALIAVYVDGTPGANDMPGRLVFSTTADGASSPSERMRIGNNGSVQIGSGGQLATERFRVTSTSTWGAAIENSNNASGDRNLYLTLGTNCNNTSSYFLDCTTAGVGPKFYVYGNGTYGTVSDINLKKNIEATRDGYLDDIQKLRVVKYNWKTDNDDAPKELGWIAQELAEVFPGLVQDSQPDPDGNTVKEVKTSVLPFILLKALQEAAEQIKDLQAEVAALKAH